MADSETLLAVAQVLDWEATDRIKEADDARNGTGTFEHLGPLPMVDATIDLAGISQVNLIIANAFAEMAKKIRALA